MIRPGLVVMLLSAVSVTPIRTAAPIVVPAERPAAASAASAPSAAVATLRADIERRTTRAETAPLASQLGLAPADAQQVVVLPSSYLTAAVPANRTGSKVRVLDKEGKLQGSHTVSGGDGRGGQAAPTARFALKPGTYKVEVQYSTGVKRMREVVVQAGVTRGVIDDSAPQE